MAKDQASNVKLTPKILLKPRKATTLKIRRTTFRSFTAYASALSVFVSVVGLSHQIPGGESISSLLTTKVSATQNDSSVDDATALYIAGNMALRANLPVAANITNRSTSLFVKNTISQDSAAVTTKPRISLPTSDEHSILSHVVVEGDSPQTIADQYGVSVQTIKWANNLNTDALEVGTTLLVPPVDGVLYTTKEGDTIEAIAEKYKSDAQQIVAFNDLELSGVKHDQQIVLPNGELPAEERPDYVAPVPVAVVAVSTPAAPVSASVSSSSSLVNGYSPITMTASGNAYAFGNCTSWAYERRVQLGHPVGSYWGNGATWDSSARAAGYTVDKNPTVGAVYQMPAYIDAYTGPYGHVGIVEAVNADGSVYISEMNYAGNFNVVTYRTIPAAQVALYNYIH